LVGRNDPCPCGSGKKYKKCHGAVQTSMPRFVKSPEQIEGMRKAGQFNGQLLDFIRPHVAPGISTAAIDQLVEQYTRDHGHTPATKGYHGFPKSCCISRNEVVCHGIPSEQEFLLEGDIVNVDLTTIVDGFYGDQSETFILGDVDEKTRHLVGVTAESLLRAIAAIKPGVHLQIVAETIEPFVKNHGYSVVKQYTGHGLGTEFHEHFSVYHHVEKGARGPLLQAGMTFTIEPMVNAGTYKVVTDPVDNWTVRTKDGALSAQFEHTVLVTDSGVEILTLTPAQRQAALPLVSDSYSFDTPENLRALPYV